MFVYLFPVPSSPICKCHCLSVESHLSVTDCFLLKHFYLNSSRVVCLRTRGGREKYPLPTTPCVPVVTYILNCSIYDTALIFYMPSLLIYLLSGCLFN